ncbi:hypothetical protein CGRA01v4_11844 [Colletotrichum graminicola]|nr:hypothetical protein CGRA01v4_11844 [Colletotrichum graminicola]
MTENLVLRRQACRYEETSFKWARNNLWSILSIHIRVSRLDGETGTMSPSERGVLSFAAFLSTYGTQPSMTFQVLHVKTHTTFVPLIVLL